MIEKTLEVGKKIVRFGKQHGDRLLLAAYVSAVAVRADAGGLSRATSTITAFTADVKVLIGVVAVLGVIVTAVMWGFKVLRFWDFARLGGGILLAGCAAEIVAAIYV